MDLFFIVYGIVVIIVLGMFVKVIGGGIVEWVSNNAAELIEIRATVLARRTEVGHSHSNGHTHRYTRYYVTFGLESGERIELQLKGSQFGVILEGDEGTLSYQGTRFLGFER